MNLTLLSTTTSNNGHSVAAMSEPVVFCIVLRAGETVHVDFGCLFDRGLVLEVPERVPFRLTQNVVDCFGVSGVEGTFRRAAEMTLQVWPSLAC